MSIGKIAMALATLVIVGLLIFALIKVIIPSAFDYVTCAVKAFLNPSGNSTGLASCTSSIKFSLDK